ncbi:MAG: PIN domain-containing protein [Thermomicrobiales bacterium]|nr:PIN domain-containing protein [Thermomicrobiales bacterium]
MNDAGAVTSGFLDSNIFIRFFTWDHPEHARLARDLFERVELGEIVVHITDTVVFETAFTLEKFYRAPRQQISDAWMRLLELPALVAANKQTLRETFALWVSRSNRSFADCFHLVSAKAMGLDTMITFDRNMSIPGVRRVEPPL